LPENSYLNRWAQYAIEAGEEIGKPFDITDKIGRWLVDSGFENITEKYYKTPIGPWERDPHLREIGRYNLLNLLEGMV
jgi:hypothetical protein